MTDGDIDLDAILSRHKQRTDIPECQVAYCGVWPCEPARMAEAIRAALSYIDFLHDSYDLGPYNTWQLRRLLGAIG